MFYVFSCPSHKWTFAQNFLMVVRSYPVPAAHLPLFLPLTSLSLSLSLSDIDVRTNTHTHTAHRTDTRAHRHLQQGQPLGRLFLYTFCNNAVIHISSPRTLHIVSSRPLYQAKLLVYLYARLKIQTVLERDRGRERERERERREICERQNQANHSCYKCTLYLVQI